MALTYLDAVIDRGKEDPSVRARTVFHLALFDKGSVLDAGENGRGVVGPLVRQVPFSRMAVDPLSSGQAHFERKEYREAFDELLPLKDETFEKETTPINVPQMKKWLYRALGVSALFVDNFAVAEECFLTAIESDPSDRAAYHHLAVARERKGDVEGAIAACRLGLERRRTMPISGRGSSFSC